MTTTVRRPVCAIAPVVFDDWHAQFTRALITYEQIKGLPVKRSIQIAVAIWIGDCLLVLEHYLDEPSRAKLLRNQYRVDPAGAERYIQAYHRYLARQEQEQE